MKNLKKIIIAVALVCLTAAGASAQFRWGVKVGTEINSIHFNKDIANDLTNSDNRAGFTGGLTTEFTVPVVGIGFDASVMYVHRGKNLPDDITKLGDKSLYSTDYIEIPINLKYKIGLPVVGKIITPYLFTGPSFAFLTSKKEINEFLKNKSCDVAWNFGLGVELLSHLQIGASYGIGITKEVESTVKIGSSGSIIEGKNKYWTVTAAYLF